MQFPNHLYNFFAQELLAWYDKNGRHDLPWQVNDDPYKVWVSEIMLQQTQVKTVLKYFPNFIQRFPTVNDLAEASWEDVAPFWAGLGYYARARNLHKACKIVAEHGFPSTLEQWQELPGIGRSTAGALMSLGLRKYGVILDGNVKRVLARFFAIEKDLSKSPNEKQLWLLAEEICPEIRNADYTQAIMDLGATICTPKKALCLYCPLQQQCLAYKHQKVDLLPIKKAKKAVPNKFAKVLILKYQDQWLWTIRKNHGLWGGLYCLPILNNDDFSSFSQHLAQLNIDFVSAPEEITHQFTHFIWHLSPIFIQLNHADHWQAILKNFPDENVLDYEWLNYKQTKQKALPSAMKKLISALQSHYYTSF